MGINVLYKTVHAIDYDAKVSILKAEVSKNFDIYLQNLLASIRTNTSVKSYKIRTQPTDVYNDILQIISKSCSKNLSEQKILEHFESISDKLLDTEIGANNRVAQLNGVKKGSLVQSLLHDNSNNKYFFLIAKVEHTQFIEDIHYDFSSGFLANDLKDDLVIWKSCMFTFGNEDNNLVNEEVKIFQASPAVYWHNLFLEVDEIRDDYTNTQNAYTHVVSTLSNIKISHPSDFVALKSKAENYFVNHAQIDFSNLVDNMLDYTSDTLDSKMIQKLNSDMKKSPPIKRDFDYHFNSKPDEFRAAEIIYPISEGISLRISANSQKEQIVSFFEDGIRYLKIRVNDLATFEEFKT